MHLKTWTTRKIVLKTTSPSHHLQKLHVIPATFPLIIVPISSAGLHHLKYLFTPNVTSLFHSQQLMSRSYHNILALTFLPSYELGNLTQ